MVFDDSGFHNVAAGGCVQTWPYGSWSEPTTTETVVETFEYDEQGRVTRKTVTTTRTTTQARQTYTYPTQWYSSTVQGF